MRARSLAAVTIILAIVGARDLSSQARSSDAWSLTSNDRSNHGDQSGKCDRDHDRDAWGRGHDRDQDRDRHGDADDCKAAAAAGTGVISGTVTGDLGPVSGWKVYLLPTGGAAVSAVTGADGSYSFTALKAGAYLVCEGDPTPDAEELPANGSSSNSVPCSGYAPFGYSLTLANGSTLTGNNFLNGSGGVVF